jgi:hypothetical protein
MAVAAAVAVLLMPLNTIPSQQSETVPVTEQSPLQRLQLPLGRLKGR